MATDDEPLEIDRPETGDDSLDLSGFAAKPRDDGASIDQLSQAFAEMMGEKLDPYAPAESGDAAGDDDPGAGQACEISPRTILEALLFVGRPDNQPLASAEVAAMMRGVRPAEVDQLVRELNEQYEADGSPYRIAEQGAGYRLILRDEYAGVRQKMFGRLRESRLSQAAVDVLSIVAYRQPIKSDDVNRLRGKMSGGILSQLVRRCLLRIERTADEPRKPSYHTTDRFLELFGLESLDELPRPQDVEEK